MHGTIYQVQTQVPKSPKKGRIPRGHAEDKERSVQCEGAELLLPKEPSVWVASPSRYVCVGFGRMTKNLLSRGG